MTSREPDAAAACIGRVPRVLGASALAPLSSKKATALACPFALAQCSAVCPCVAGFWDAGAGADKCARAPSSAAAAEPMSGSL